ncbi:hypothetical protein BD770DRAFT_400926 [Pilaira anomala]|nr:hypothetical protein BD770DRAFT_400926 [Pilaira anomala]
MQSMDLATLRKINAEEVPTPPHLRAIIHNKQSSCLIGYQGQIAKHITVNLGVRFQVYETERSKWGRLVSTRGYPEALGKTWYYCAKQLISSFREHFELKKGFGIDFVFPSFLIDFFLSTGEFDYITRNTAISILVKHDCLMRSTERVVRILTRNKDEASLNQFKTAVYLLALAVQKNITLAMCAPGNVFYKEDPEDPLWKYCHVREINDIFFDGSSSQRTNDDEKVPHTV